MKRFEFVLAVVLVAALTILSGVLHGRMSNRWGPQADTVAAANKLKDIPNEFGDWRLLSSDDLDRASTEQLRPVGSIVRTYKNLKTGDVVSMFIVLGSPGPISVHTPEICFGTKNYESRTERRKVSIDGPAGAEDEFWSLDFKAISLQGDLLRVYYAWSPGDRWQAVDDPRFWSAGFPYLYKIQLSTSFPPGTMDPRSDDPGRRFLRDFVPVAKKCLIAPAAK